MAALSIAVAAAVVFAIAYRLYGGWLTRRVFALDPRAAVPSVTRRDDVDFVPTRRAVVFGHHFASIAGTGPIVGPAIAVLWGWVPALLWILFGSIFVGAVHDLGALVISLRHRGETIGEIAGRVIHPRVRILFTALLLFALWIVLAVFGLVIASVFRLFPAAILPVFLQIPIALWIGAAIHRRGGRLLGPSIVALALMYATVWFGAGCPGLAWDGGAIGGAVRSINETLAAWPVWGWTLVLFAYCHVASVLPVWALLQPRDYINALQLLSGLAIVVAGLVVTATFGSNGRALAIVAPAIAAHPAGAPPIWPFLFVTVACGAVSGFHCLVSSGTTSKQLRSETDATFVAYGGMLTEGFLAVLVLISVAAGIGLGWSERFGELAGTSLWNAIYRDWASADAGLGTKVGAFVVGAANLVEGLGIPHVLATALLGVLVASFAGTTLDTATRLQRYVVQELAGRTGIGWLSRPHGATLFAVASAWLLAMFPMPGKPWTAQWIGTGGLALWPLFGAVNQLLGGLAFLVVTFWLRSHALPWKFAFAPTTFMLVMPAWALALQTAAWWNEGSRVLAVTALAVLGLETWMVREGFALRMRLEDRSQARSRIRAFPDAA